MELTQWTTLASKASMHIDAFNVARWVPYPARSKRAGAVLGVPSTDEVGPTKSRKGPIPKPCGSGLWHSTKEKNMMTQFEHTTWWNYTTNQYQPVIIERTFNRGAAHITIHRWL